MLPILADASGFIAVLNQLDGDLVIVHARGFRVDAGEVFDRVKSVGVARSAVRCHAGAFAAVSAVEAFAKTGTTRGRTGHGKENDQVSR